MDDISCPEPEHLRKATEIRREVNRVAFAASWPSTAVSAILSFLTAGTILIATAAGADEWISSTILLLLLVYPSSALDQRIARKFIPTNRNLDLNIISVGDRLPWWGYVLAIPAALPIGLIAAAGQGTGMAFVAAFWAWLGIVWLADGWVGKRWNQLLMGFFWLTAVVILGRSTPKGENVSNEFAILLSIAGITEAGFAWWAWREWKKDPARFESILT